ncbi:MAG: cytochrome c biogenesis protein ResB [Verrucomicrobiae bacterium]|nr:cytochrome c biogenesis protein ResB [Verrucomicrobiae bacterium]
MLDRLIKIFTSLRLTIVLLSLGMILVFWGTLAQVTLGLYKAQNDFFRSFFVFWSPEGSDWQIPIFPGGYLIGGLLLINLLAAHTRYYRPSKKKIGIVFIHFGVVLLLVGQLLTDFLSVESTLHLREGETKNYSEASRSFELAVVDVTDRDLEKQVAISHRRLSKQDEIKHPELPFTLKATTFFANSELKQREEPGFQPVKGVKGIGEGVWMRELPHETMMDRRDVPTAVVEISGPEGSPQSYLASAHIARPQSFQYGDRTYEISMRPVRYYKPFSMHLLEFTHDRYPGTQIPKNFSSRVILNRPETGEKREVLIYMNNPLRYWGETYYQSSFDTDDQGSYLQVVRNPSWLTPYFSCVLVSIGLTIQFLMHLVPFLKRRLAT